MQIIYLLVELPLEGSAINGTTPSSIFTLFVPFTGIWGGMDTFCLMMMMIMVIKITMTTVTAKKITTKTNATKTTKIKIYFLGFKKNCIVFMIRTIEEV